MYRSLRRYKLIIGCISDKYFENHWNEVSPERLHLSCKATTFIIISFSSVFILFTRESLYYCDRCAPARCNHATTRRCVENLLHKKVYIMYTKEARNKKRDAIGIDICIKKKRVL